MILLDTNILSTFCKIRRLSLIFEVLKKEVLYISPNVFKELKKARDKGYSFSNNAFESIKNNRLQVINLTPEEKTETIKIPSSFAAGERDSIVVCKKRSWIFITNEKKVINYCKKQGIMYFDLIDILKAMHEFMGYSKEDIRSLIEEIEKKDNILIKNKEEIFG